MQPFGNVGLAAVLCSAVSVVVGAWQAPPPAAARHVSLAAKSTKSAKSEDVTANLGTMMASSQESLAQAEALYDKAMQKEKQSFDQLLTTEAKVLAASIGDLAGSLSNASVRLAQAANATRASVKAAKTAPSGQNGTSFAAVEELAILGAKADAADVEARHLARKAASSATEAVSKSTLLLEDAEGRLSRKLGDLSAIADGAKAILEASDPGADAAADHTQKIVQNAASLGKPANVAEIKQSLAAASGSVASEVAAAQKRWGAVLTQASASLSAGTSSIKAALAAAEKVELQRVRDHKVDPTPAPQRRHRHRHH